MGNRIGKKENTRFNVRHAVVKTFEEYMPKPYVDNVSGSLKYVGYAMMGVDEDSDGWRIEKHEIVGTVTKVTYAGGTMEFVHKWSDRASLNYSR